MKETEEECVTLSEMGIDFGAAELGRFAKLGLSDDQKKKALNVVRLRKSKIEKLCDRMTLALALSEGTLKEKKSKERELANIQGEFKTLQKEIISRLHGLVSDEQMVKLRAMKEREAEKAEKPGKRS